MPALNNSSVAFFIKSLFVPTRRAKKAVPRKTRGPCRARGPPDRRGFRPTGWEARFWRGGVEFRGATKVILHDRRPAKAGK
jgi:hypothetical protein